MDFKLLLQDLHFRLSNTTGSTQVQSQGNHLQQERNLCLEFEDRTKMTEKWVAQVHLRNRQRSMSSDSYFGVESICDRLKKSFFKPLRVTDNDLEDLRIRMSQMKIEESDINIASTISKFSNVAIEEDIKIDVNKVSTKKQETQRFRSQTVPSMLYLAHKPEITTTLTQNEGEVGMSIPTCMASLQSVDLIKDILLDENRNQLVQEPLVSKCEVHETLVCEEITIVKSFRNESIIPFSQDLKTMSKISKSIRPNRIIGSYENEFDYLKTQFDLLKADFILPLKEGIADYKRQLRNGTIPNEVKNLKLYHSVYITEPYIKQNQLGIAVDMGSEISEKIGEKDFMNGSFVLLTPNHFKDIFVGIVLSRNFAPALQQKGKPYYGRKGKNKSNILMVQLKETSHFDPTLKRQRILLAESKAFFQPYYYVMKIFQGMDDSDLPLKEYLIKSETKEVIESPPYLQSNTLYFLGNTIQATVLNEATWPSAEVLEVNDSQLAALKRALTEKLVLIQGPPGTGKTYLGCKVAKALLLNKQVWNEERNRPMLIMCQTNHALDQFLELLVPVTKKLIRIGSQSKSNILTPFNIQKWMKKSNRVFSKSSEVKNLKLNLEKIAQDIQVCYTELTKITSYGVLDLQTLVDMGVMNLKHSLCFNNSENFLIWLEEARDFQVVGECHGQCKSHTGDSRASLKCHGKNNSNTFYNERDNLSNYHSKTQEVPIQFNDSDFGTLENISVKYIISLPDLELALREWQGANAGKPAAEQAMQKNTEKKMENRLKFFKQCVLENAEEESEQPLVSCLWNILPHLRWALYRSWVRKLSAKLQSHLQLLESQYLSASSACFDLEQYKKLEVMREAEVVGMTTSAAARLYPVLRELRSSIVIVEEAAEVHESHIVATITKYCQHLILLGDHKQLRPRPSSYELSKTHFTDVSLFERLLLNNITTVNTLLTQHRMQPQISELIRPSIYAELYDHECTKKRNSIIGMKKNVFFFSHGWPESRNPVTGSYSNPNEANMAVQLLIYLLKQGYSLNEICILTAYRQQVSEIQTICSLHQDVLDAQVLTVDNFQGEESRIVILSLVRNNRQNQIGFLKIENRTCVALSRARDGLFILGNMELLSYNSELWSTVHRVLQNNGSVGHFIPLSCKRHPESYMAVFQPNDLLTYSERGCEQICSYKLSCGHSCIRRCHSDDALHLKYRCVDQCKTMCGNGHKCQRRCWEECGQCKVTVFKHLPCGHRAQMKCFQITNHQCQESCTYFTKVRCWMPSVSQKYCTKQCPIVLKCGHQCPSQCNSLKHPHHEVQQHELNTCSACRHLFNKECTRNNSRNAY